MRNLSRNVALPLVIIALTTPLLVGSKTPTSTAETQVAASGVTLEQRQDRIVVKFGGDLFTEYRFKDVPRPFCYPVLGPGGAAVTRNYPMQAAPGEGTDHPHHRSLWYAHGSVNGHNFWSEEKNAGRIVQRELVRVKSGAQAGSLVTRNDWVSAGGEVICQDQRELTFSRQGAGADEIRVLDFFITLIAARNEVVFGDTKEGTMAMRVAESMRVKGGLNQGHIRNSAGAVDGGAWGKTAAWCDYSGPVNGQTFGVSILDHPANPRHPTWWHVRDYGLFAANPFGKHDFEGLKDNPKAGDFVVKPGEKVTFRYRFVCHQNETNPAKIEGWFKDFAS